MKEKIFILVFILALLLPNPVYYIFRDRFDTENHENRVYAELPELSLANINNIPSGFDSWYMDRVPFKNEVKALQSPVDVFMNKYRSLFEVFNQGFSGVTVGIDRWMFYTVREPNEDSINEMFGRNLYSQEEMVPIGEALEEATDFFAGRDAQFLAYVVPNKEQVYKEYLPPIYQRYAADYTRARQLADYINGSTRATMIYPLDEMLRQKGRYNLFYKYDTHWNNVGVFAGIQPILAAAGLETEDLTDIEFEETYPSIFVDLAVILNLQDSCVDDVEYKVGRFKPDVKVEKGETAYSDDDTLPVYLHYTSNAADPREVVFIGDSFRYLLASSRLLPKYFSDVSIISRYSEDTMTEYFESHHPDIVVYELSERFVSAPEVAYGNLTDLLRETTDY